MSIHNSLLGMHETIFDNRVLESLISGSIETLSVDVENVVIYFAFARCPNLTTIELTKIRAFTGGRPFADNPLLRTVIIRTPDVVPTLSDMYTFQNTPINSLDGVIYVPDNLLEEYKTATYWSTFASIMKGLSEL